MEVASLGALFLLAALGPALLAGATDLTTIKDDTGWKVIIGLIGAAGIGALLQLTGRAVWEFFLPLSPEGGIVRLRMWPHRAAGWLHKRQQQPAPASPEWLGARVRDFRAEIARSKVQEQYWKLAAPTESTEGFSDGGPGLESGTGPEPPWSYGHRVIITAEYFLYSEAKDGLLQWIRRRYQRFVDALSAAAAIFLGILIGAFLPGQNIGWMLFLDCLLVLVALATVAFANESRREAQQMEKYWYNVRAHKASQTKKTLTGVEPSNAQQAGTGSQVLLVKADVNIVSDPTD